MGAGSARAGLFRDLVQRWIPAMAQVQAALEEGGTALEVGCGRGLGSLAIARRFPRARVIGYDRDAASIARARARAVAAGLVHRVRFEVVDCTRLPRAELDFVTTVDLLSSAPDPLALAVAIRNSLGRDGTYLVTERARQTRGDDAEDAQMADLAARSGFSRCTRLAIGGRAQRLYELRR